jgi:glycosyltransferase involved in cell wall biosynthesis
MNDPNRSPLVSVVIPTKDRRELLLTTLATVLCQQVDLEVVVVDDGSNDGTGEALADLGDDRIRVVRHETSTGVSVARNDGLAAARAPWVAFTDDDDLWAPDKLVTQLAALDDDPEARWCCTGAVVIDDHERLIGQRDPYPARDLADILLQRNVIAGGASGVVAATELVRRIDGFDPRLSVFADWDLWTRLALESPVAVVYRPMHAYRIHAMGMSTATAEVRHELDEIDGKYFQLREERGVHLNRPAMELWMGDRAQRGGRRFSAIGYYQRSVPYISRARAMAKSVEVFIWPGMTKVRNWVHGRRMTPGWRAEVEPWLHHATSGGPQRRPARPAPVAAAL